MEVEDYYAYYVLILGISEELFWNAEIHRLDRIADNKTSYDKWLAYVKAREIERRGKK